MAEEERLAAEDSAKGYRTMSVRDFVLDEQELAEQSAHVSITGMYMREGYGVYYGEVMYASRRAIFIAQNSATHPPTIPLFTDQASREFRGLLMNCRADTGASHFGCPVTIQGHAAMCDIRSISVPCLVVESGRQALLEAVLD